MSITNAQLEELAALARTMRIQPNEDGWYELHESGVVTYYNPITGERKPRAVNLSGPDGVADGAPWYADGDKAES